jgi:hypothetical protein
MSEKTRVRGFGTLCVNSAFLIQASWIPALYMLSGSPWATPRLVAAAHFFALAFAFVAPLAFGLRLWLSTPREEAGEVMRDWALRGFLPPALFAAAIQGVMRFAPHVTLGIIMAMMVAILPLAGYGLMLQREAKALDA